uniref:Uncharacterized protein n=1 Tax=Utricularia reniformis TaxID=192314 RepID=A0A1Y0AZE4_9LAMI|nr:hypothetical protein AEK19_MT0236 [Utricularia reniformis]ART30514.1 hypothetical protein AEK19_MT0236 [Utricularia reniformis]
MRSLNAKRPSLPTALTRVNLLRHSPCYSLMSSLLATFSVDFLSGLFRFSNNNNVKL